MNFRLQYPNSVAALQNLLSEALAVCHAGDPALGAALAGLLDLDAKAHSGDDLMLQDPAEARLMSFRMFVYAYQEAIELEGQEQAAEKLRVCILSLSEHLGRADVSEKPQLHS